MEGNTFFLSGFDFVGRGRALAHGCRKLIPRHAIRNRVIFVAPVRSIDLSAIFHDELILEAGIGEIEDGKP